jgi:hypothetical protein
MIFDGAAGQRSAAVAILRSALDVVLGPDTSVSRGAPVLLYRFH